MGIRERILLGNKNQKESLNELENQVKIQTQLNDELKEKISLLEITILKERSKDNSFIKKDLKVQKFLNDFKNRLQDIPYQFQEQKNIPSINSFQNVLKDIGFQDLIDNIVQSSKIQEFHDKNQLEISYNEQKVNDISVIETFKGNKIRFEANLINHLDSVRCLSFIDNQNTLISVAEDCLIKVWDLNSDNKDPIVTLREHTGPLYSVCASKQSEDPLFFTAGADGIIKMWSYPLDIDVEELSIKWNPSNEIQSHNDVIWKLILNEEKNILSSAGSDGIINMFKYDEQDLNCIFSYQQIIYILQTRHIKMTPQFQ